MIRALRSVRPIAADIATAVDGVMNAYRDQRVIEEPAITNQILGAIEARLQVRNYKGIVWNAKVLRTARGRAAEEQRHGADLLGVLDVDVGNFRTKKGFLAQAKKAEPGQSFTKLEWTRLVDQCKKMLDRTPASFVFVYSVEKGLRIIPAVSVVGFDGLDLFDLYQRAVQPFFEGFLECFIGDPRLNAPDIHMLDALANFEVDRVLAITAKKTVTDI